MIDPTLDDAGLVATGLEGLLADFGVTFGDDIVVDPANPLPFFGAETIFIGSYGDHVITRPLDQAQLPVIVPLGRSVSAAQTATAWRSSSCCGPAARAGVRPIWRTWTGWSWATTTSPARCPWRSRSSVRRKRAP